jgi:hypothetical protein
MHLTGTGNRDGQWLRVCQHGFWTADVKSVAELERFFDVADLEEALRTQGRATGATRATLTCGRGPRPGSASWVGERWLISPPPDSGPVSFMMPVSAVAAIERAAASVLPEVLLRV